MSSNHLSLKCSDSVSLSAKPQQNYMHVKNLEKHVLTHITVGLTHILGFIHVILDPMTFAFTDRHRFHW